MSTVLPSSVLPEPANLTALIGEFRDHVGLTETDAYRSAFCALAVNRGWSSARVGRYLGISRARVGQRVEKLRQYTESRDDMPVLTTLMAQPTAPTLGPDLPVAFEPSAWADREFALGILHQLAT